MTLNLNISTFSDIKNIAKRPFVIAGPCSAETEEQVLKSAEAIHNSGNVSLFRAGIWKPRTRPGSFEGVGEIGLEWLKKVKENFNMPVTVEVANALHVQKCLKAGIDVLWIGARTTANPFAVQEIADALKGTDIPVLIKNPVNPDFELWIGAFERFNKAGINKIAAIHRGFSSFEKTSFRNTPMWDIAIKLKQILPELPIIGDPSHIAGNTELIPFLSQKMIDLDFDGLMIETHISPKTAWSDAKQQLTPFELDELLKRLIVRNVESTNINFKNKLEELRKQIDNIDEEIIHKIADRMKTAQEIGKYKKDNKVTILQVSRWEDIIKERVFLANALGLSSEFMEAFLPLIHEESIRIQTKIMNEE
jgi:chorismate mutase